MFLRTVEVAGKQRRDKCKVFQRSTKRKIERNFYEKFVSCIFRTGQ
jgi:hypothetical protein